MLLSLSGVAVHGRPAISPRGFAGFRLVHRDEVLFGSVDRVRDLPVLTNRLLDDVADAPIVPFRPADDYPNGPTHNVFDLLVHFEFRHSYAPILAYTVRLFSAYLRRASMVSCAPTWGLRCSALSGRSR